MKKIPALLLALLFLFSPALAAAETIVTSFYPIYLFALNLLDGVEGVEVASLAEPGTGCLHDYQLQTGDMKLLANADALLINGAGMEGYLTGVFEAFPNLPVVDASVGVPLLEDCTEHGHDHDEHDDHGHAFNPHIWLAPKNALLMLDNLAQGLAEALPAHADEIRANRDAYQLRLSELDAALTQALAALPRRDVITFHEAFPYFAAAYDLHVAAVINRDPDDALSPRKLAELCKTVLSLGAPPLFTEPQYEDVAARTIARETGAGLYTLDPLVTGPDVPPLTLYEDVMRQNLAVLLEALGSAE